MGPSPSPLPPPLAGYANVLLDLDGCVRLGPHPIAGAGAAHRALRAAGVRVVVATNDVLLTPAGAVAQLRGMGLDVDVDDVFSVGLALQHHLALHHAAQRAFVIGPPAVHAHVEAAGLTAVDTVHGAGGANVVVAAVDVGFSYAHLLAATRLLRGGATLVGLSRDSVYSDETGILPGSGTIVAALEAAGGVVATVVGKPEPAFFRAALDRVGPGPTLVVGDSLEADVEGARAVGIDAAVVLTGVTDRAAADAARAAGAPIVAIADSLATLVAGDASSA